MRDDLVALQVEIDPGVGRPALGAAEQAAVEGARVGQRGDRKGEVERMADGHGACGRGMWSGA